MLAALLATRPPVPPPVLTYQNQFVAATTTFACIALAKRAAALTTNPAVMQRLLFSFSAHVAIVDQLELVYSRLINAPADDEPTYLSDQIVQSIAILVVLNSIIQTLTVTSQNKIALIDLQTRMALTLRIMNSLAVPPGSLSFS